MSLCATCLGLRSNPSVSGTVTDIFVFFCEGDSWLSRLIMRVSSKSHCGIGFTVRPDPSCAPVQPGASSTLCQCVYFESLFGKGFQGPRYLRDLYDWRDADPRRKVTVLWLGVSPELAHLKFVRASFLVGKLGYAEWQLLAMWWFERVGKRFNWHVPRSPHRAVCSESVARILFPDIDTRDPIHDRLDEITPGSLYEALKKWLRAKEPAPEPSTVQGKQGRTA